MRATGRPSASPLSSPSVAFGAIIPFARRYRLAPLLGAVVVALLVAATAQRSERARSAAEAQWNATTTVWVANGPLEAGAAVGPGDAVRLAAPAALAPADALHDDPTGRRVRSPVGEGEILVATRLTDAGSEIAARTPQGWRTLRLPRTSELFSVGDRLDLHHLVDGHRLAVDAVVVAVTEGDLGVAVPRDVVGDVVRALGQAGVVPVLTE